MKKILLVDIICSLLVILFTYTALSKFLEHEKFVFQMELAPVAMMHYVAPALGWIVPSVEVLIVILLLSDRTRMIGLLTSLALLSLFEIYISAMLLSGLHLPCTCGGFISKMSWRQHLGFNAFFILLIILAIIQHKKFRSAIGIDKDISQNLSHV